MFEFVQDLTVTRKVTVQVPVDGTTFKAQSFHAVFKIIPNKRVIELSAEGGDVAVLREVLVGWEPGEIRGADKQPIDFSEENRDALIAVPFFALATIRAYNEAALGGRQGN